MPVKRQSDIEADYCRIEMNNTYACIYNFNTCVCACSYNTVMNTKLKLKPTETHIYKTLNLYTELTVFSRS